MTFDAKAQDCPSEFQIAHERICGTDSYTVEFSVSGGTAPYSLTDGDYSGILTEGEVVSFTKSDGEDYILFATDAAGCTVRVETDLTPCSKLESCPDTYQVNHERDCGPVLIGGQGEFIVNFSVEGGTAPYSVADGNYTGVLEEGEAASFSVSDGNGYGFTVTDADGCIIVINEADLEPCSKGDCPSTFSVDHIRNCDPIFEGGGEYEVVFSISGGTAPYSVADGNYTGILEEGEQASFFVPDGNGYEFVVTDANGCRIEVRENDLVPCSKVECPPSFAIVDTFDCTNVQDAGSYDVTFSVSGGVAPYIVSGDFSGLLDEAEEITFPVTEGEGYTLTVSDAESCVQTIEREAPFCSKSCPGPQAIVEVDCAGAAANGEYSISITVSGTVPPYIVTGTLGDQFLDEGGQINATVPNGTQVFIAINDAEGCGPTLIDTVYNCIPDVAVELLSFEGEASQEGNILTWSTASETNNDYFTILHSTDGANFETIGQVAGNGNASAINNYSFTDKNASTGLNYYYLVQTDQDGSTTSYEVIVVSRGEVGFEIIRLFPTPASSSVNLTFTNDQMSTVDISLYDITGRIVMNRSVNTTVGVNEVNMDITNLSKGVYFVKVNDGIRTTANVLLKD